MPRFLGFPNNTTTALDLGSFTQTKVSCSGASGATSLTATGSFSPGNRLFIWQGRGGGNVGKYEDNRVLSYTSGTITLAHPLENTYTDSGNEQAQVLVVPEVTSVTGSYTVPAWDGDVGGIVVIACDYFNGVINGDSAGYLGGLGWNLNNYAGYAEGTAGVRLPLGSLPGSSNANNGNGGGSSNSGSGAGGGNGAAGTNGVYVVTGPGGLGGAAVGQADLTTGIFMGGGAGGSIGAQSLPGGNGGGVAVIYARKFGSSTAVSLKGGNGGNHTIATGSGGSGGAGGSLWMVSQDYSLVSSANFSVAGGTGGTGSGSPSTSGVSGAVGRIRVIGCSGTTISGASQQTGGFSFCGSFVGIL
jgi:hypothetical protein